MVIGDWVEIVTLVGIVASTWGILRFITSPAKKVEQVSAVKETARVITADCVEARF
ncbi:MAG: hypothetical protein PHS41_07340 [Victivallaceae bacterium]|nr:hypothetical protein [Victivallaceae bacterium]